MTDWDEAYQLGLRNGLELGRKAERERIRQRIEALPSEAEGPGADSVILQDVLEALGGEAEIECCPVCEGVTEHVLGCPEMDKPR